MSPGNWRLAFCGASHATSTLEQREPLQIGTDELGKANALFGGLHQTMESLVLSTCNRVEFYFVAGSDVDPLDVVAEFYRKFNATDLTPHRNLFSTKKGSHVAAHLFRVAAGLDSMVLGENQILGQLRDAYSSACAVKSAGKIIHRLLHQAFRAGKQVRSDTDMGKGACSVAAAAVELLRDSADIPDRPVILFVGVNRMISLAADRFSRSHHSKLIFANRTEAKAHSLASKFNGEGASLDRLTDMITEADVVFSCTSATEPIITARMLEEVVGRRSDRTCVIMDLAIPRDVERLSASYPTLQVYDMDDIKRLIAQQQERRAEAVPQAEEILQQRLSEFKYWYHHVLHEPIYNGRSNTLEAIREEELASIVTKLPPELQTELNKASRRLVDRVINIASRTAAGDSERE
ncbi:MAG: glutamyl-tRNA reductase [Candidatus Zixiibacteriota bacterium]|nr:MAG: glutamyl-tRNA reductase [candidate division Zixibacteria bacterium]